MKIESVRIQNFRCFQDETVEFNDYTCLVGANGSGKSTVLTALRVFFRDAGHSPTDLVNLQAQDFYRGNPSQGDEVVITVTFSGLDAEAKEDLKHYVRQEKLIVSAVASWNAQTRSAEVKQYGQRMVFKPFADFFKADGDGAKVPELAPIYAKLRESFTELPSAATKPKMVEALHAYESSHPELLQLERSEDQFYGFTKGTPLLKKHLEWVFIPAVRDAAEEQFQDRKTALGTLLDRAVRSKTLFSEALEKIRSDAQEEYAKMLAEKQSVLGALSEALTKRIREWAHPDAGLKVEWRDDPSRNVSIQDPQAEVCAVEGELRLAISRMGHGLQRSFLLALLQELSGCPDSGKPRLLLACEEPELYQHPPQARHLSSVLQNLSGSNAQVIVSTHSPLFVSGRGFPHIRLFRREVLDDQPTVRSVAIEELSRCLSEARGQDTPNPSALELKIEQILQPRLNEMFFTPVLVLVEGDEDIGYIETYLELSERYGEFRRLGCHIVPTSGKGKMIYTLAIANRLDIPTFVVFDADGDETRPDKRAQHEQDNLALLRLAGIDKPNAFSSNIFWTRSVVMWPTQIGKAVREDVGTEQWEKCEGAVQKKHLLTALGDPRKNGLFIGLVLTALHEGGTRCKILDFLCKGIISFAQQERSGAVQPPAGSGIEQTSQPGHASDAERAPTAS